MKLIITEDNVGLLAATYTRAMIKAFNPTADNPFVLALPTGGTALDLYKNLILFHQQGQLSFEHVVTFNLDEYVNFDVNHPESYHSFMRRNFFSHIDMPAANINIPNGNAPDLQAEAALYEEKIKSYGGIDLFLGGVGVNGHIAFNEPGSAFDSKTRVVDLTESTIKANARFFDNDLKAVPAQALTMGLGTIFTAREVIIMATGLSKSQAVYRAIEGKRDTQWPITVLQNHPHAHMVADKAAASEVSTAAEEKLRVCHFTPPEGKDENTLPQR